MWNIQKKCRDLQLFYRDEIIINIDRYKYLGNIVDQSLNIADDFNIEYKKVSSRIKILSKIRPSLSFTAAAENLRVDDSTTFDVLFHSTSETS